MKTVCQVNQCTGCMACVELCPKNAINIKDDLVSYNAVIDNTKCVECMSCIKIMCLSRLFIKEKARGQGIGRSIVAYAQKLAEGDGRSRLYLRIWARDLKAEGFAKKCRFRKAETVPMEVLPGTTLDITTWEKLWR